jgi:hypothetical protein
MTSPEPSPTARRVAAPGEGLLHDISLPTRIVDSGVVATVVDLAIEIAREGREGRKIGTLFTVGAHEQVLARSRCLILDPLANHPPELRSLRRPDTRETIKELAQLDGAFVISADGIAVSACRYLEASLDGIEPQLGLGTRHIAAASITRSTPTVAVVVSESSVVRVFHDGRLVTEILPELWLLRRFSPHFSHAYLPEHPAENLVVVSSADIEPGTAEPGTGEATAADG